MIYARSVPRSVCRLRVVVVTVLVLAASACGSDDSTAPDPGATTTGTVDSATDDTAEVTTTTASADTTTTTAPTTTTTTTTTGPETTTSVEPAPPTEDVELLCAAYEQLFTTAFFLGLATFDDPEAGDLLLLAAMPALAPAWQDAVATFPIDGVSSELQNVTRDATEVLSRAAAAVLASDVDQTTLAVFGQALLAGPEPAEVLPEEDLDELLDDEFLDQLAAVDFDIDAAFDDVDDPDTDELAVLCPVLAEFLGVGEALPVGSDACDVVTDVTLTIVFWPAAPDHDPDDVGSGMCSWVDTAGRELVVSLTDARTVERTRDDNTSAFDVVSLPGLGDDAWSIEGLLTGVSTTGGRGGFGGGRATVGVIVGETGLLVAVVDADGNAAPLAEAVAEEITPRLPRG